MVIQTCQLQIIRYLTVPYELQNYFPKTKNVHLINYYN